MQDAERRKWWPDFETVVAELRRAGHAAVADLLLEAVRSGATSSEIPGRVGIVLHEHRALRPQLSDGEAKAWDAIMDEVYRAFPGSRLARWFARLAGR